jgi:hypothetical protein
MFPREKSSRDGYVTYTMRSTRDSERRSLTVAEYWRGGKTVLQTGVAIRREIGLMVAVYIEFWYIYRAPTSSHLRTIILQFISVESRYIQSPLAFFYPTWP